MSGAGENLRLAVINILNLSQTETVSNIDVAV